MYSKCLCVCVFVDGWQSRSVTDRLRNGDASSSMTSKGYRSVRSSMQDKSSPVPVNTSNTLYSPLYHKPAFQACCVTQKPQIVNFSDLKVLENVNLQHTCADTCNSCHTCSVYILKLHYFKHQSFAERKSGLR